MTPSSYVRVRQVLWARRRGLRINESAYVSRVDDNLFASLSKAAIDQFNRADGGELCPRRKHRPKMQALHSSSALAVNVFHHWLSRDKTLLAKALGVPSRSLESIEFESLAPVAPEVDRKIFPKDPNIDVVLRYARGGIREIGIESKFSEAYGKHDGLRTAYLEDSSLWRGLPHCRRLAERVCGPAKVDGLNIPQLLKHLLGLKNRSGIGRFWLVYLWYATPGIELGEHFQQLEEFKGTLARDGIRFHFQTYQQLICSLAAVGESADRAYIDYLASRYL